MGNERPDKYAADGGRLHAMAPILALVVLAGLILFHSLGGYSDHDRSGHAWGTDDAYISYRYAANLAAGDGLVFNPGERVEGYSNLLYVLMLAGAAGTLGEDSMYPVSSLLNLVLCCLAFIAFYGTCRRRLAPSGVTAATWLFALVPALWAWSASGLETMLVLAVSMAVWLEADAVVRDKGRFHLPLLGVAVVLSVLSRADGFLVPFFVCVWLIVRRSWRAAAWAGGFLVVSQGLLTMWRLVYYGWPLPNTYYAKVSGPLLERIADAGAQLVNLSVHQRLALPLGILVLLGGRVVLRAVRRTGVLRSELGFETVFTGGLIVYWFYVGGDVFIERFLLPLFPMAILAGIEWVARFPVKSLVSLAASLAALVQLSLVSTDPRFDYVPASKKYDRWVRLGNFLGERYPGMTVATDAAGKIPFHSGLETIDMLGLTDEYLAHREVSYFAVGHNKFDADYVLGRRPDIITSWILPNRDLLWGLTRDKYVGAGYHLAFLVNVDPSPKIWVLDMRGMDGESIKRLMSHGYQYAVLMRNGWDS